MDAKAALEQMALFGKPDLYGPLADGLGRCACSIAFAPGQGHTFSRTQDMLPEHSVLDVGMHACRLCEWLSMRVERPDVRQQGGAQRYEGVWAGAQVACPAMLSPPRQLGLLTS